MNNKNLTEYYNQFNFTTIPLIPNKKIPYLKGWQNITKSKKLRDDDNIGVLTGKKSNIIVVDIDKGGLDIWRKWIRQHGRIDTPTTKTGDGYHLFFQYDKDIKNKVKLEYEG